MYNGALKQRFIEECYKNGAKKTIETISSMVKRIGELEDVYRMEASNWTPDIVREAIYRATSGRYGSKSAYIQVLRKYFKWCKEIGVDGVQEWDDSITATQIESSRKGGSNFIKSPQALQDILNKVCEPIERDTIDNIIRAYFWLAYGGVGEGDAMTLTSRQLNFPERIINCGNYDAYIYEEGVEALKKSSQMKEFKRDGMSKAGNKVTFVRERLPGDYLLRTYDGDCPEIRNFRGKVMRICKRYRDTTQENVSLTYTRVYLSGLFYRMRKRELQGVDINFRAIADLLRETEMVPSSESKNVGTINSRAVNLKRDYISWKKAFYEE